MPADTSAAAVPHAHELLDQVIAYLRGRPELVEPIAVTEVEAARLVSLSYKTLSALPAEKTGRFRVGRAVRYHLATLRTFAAELIGKTIET